MREQSIWRWGGDQSNAESIEKGMKTAFPEDSFKASNKLRRVAWTGESVDVYAVE